MSNKNSDPHYTPSENSSTREAPRAMEKGTAAYKQMISDHNKNLDKYSNLPYAIGKPTKRSSPIRDVYVKCLCERVYAVNKNTCGIECNACKKYVSVSDLTIVNQTEVDD